MKRQEVRTSAEACTGNVFGEGIVHFFLKSRLCGNVGAGDEICAHREQDGGNGCRGGGDRKEEAKSVGEGQG